MIFQKTASRTSVANVSALFKSGRGTLKVILSKELSDEAEKTMKSYDAGCGISVRPRATLVEAFGSLFGKTLSVRKITESRNGEEWGKTIFHVTEASGGHVEIPACVVEEIVYETL